MNNLKRIICVILCVFFCPVITAFSDGEEETLALDLANYDFEIENPIYLNAQGQPVKEGEQIFSIKNVNLYPYRAGSNGNEFQGLNSDFSYSGEKSILVKQGYMGGLYSAVITKPHILYVYAMYASPAADTLKKSLKLADSSSVSNGRSLKVYSPDLTETADGVNYLGGGTSSWTLSSDNAGKWERVERVFYSDTDESVSRNLHFTAPTGTGSENGLYKFYMDDLYIGRIFRGIDGGDSAVIPKNGTADYTYKLKYYDDKYSRLIKNQIWSMTEQCEGVTLSEDGRLSVAAEAEEKSVTIRLDAVTTAGTETFYKTVALKKEKTYEIGFETLQPFYLNKNGLPVKADDTICRVLGIPVRANGNAELLSVTDETASNGKNSLKIKSGFSGGIYSDCALAPNILYDFCISLKPEKENSGTLALKNLNGGNLKVYDEAFLQVFNLGDYGEHGGKININKNDNWKTIRRAIYIEDGDCTPSLSWVSENKDDFSYYADDISLKRAIGGIDGKSVIDVGINDNAKEKYSLLLSAGSYEKLINSVSWEIAEEGSCVLIDENGNATVNGALENDKFTVKATVNTKAGTEVFYKTVRINRIKESYDILSYDFEIESPEYLNAQGKPVSDGEQIFSIRNLNLYPYRAGNNGNEFQGLNSDFSYSGEKSILVKQGYVGGLYASVRLKPHTLYVYSMQASPASDTKAYNLKLADTVSGKTLKVYSSDLTQTADGYLYSGVSGKTTWRLSPENVGEWESVERAFYSDTESDSSRNLLITVPTGTGTENGLYKFYMDDLYIGRAFQKIDGKDNITIPQKGTSDEAYTLLSFDPKYEGLINNKTWSIESSAQGVEISENGILTVTAQAYERAVTLKLTVDTKIGTEVFYKTVQLKKPYLSYITCKDSQGREITRITDNFTAEIRVENKAETPLAYHNIYALYDKSTNTLKEILKMTDYTCKGNDVKITKDEITVNNYDENSYIKIMVWNDVLGAINDYKLLGYPIKNEIFVSENGDDNADGTLENPFKTLMRAKEAVQELIAVYGIPDGGITVYLREGTYYLKEGFTLDGEASGADGKPIVWKNYNNETVKIAGSIRLDNSDFEKVTDTAVLSRIYDASARDKIYSLDLSKYVSGEIPAVPHYGKFQEMAEKGGKLYFKSEYTRTYELYSNGSVMNVASWPNNGEYAYYDMADVVSTDGKLKIAFENDRINGWLNASEHRLYGFWGPEWADWSAELCSYTDGIMEINSSLLYAMTGNKRRFKAYNLIEELDSTGEYYIDRENKKLYCFFENGYDGMNLSLGVLNEPLFSLKCDNVIISGLNFGETRSSAIYIDGENNIIENCEISGTPTTAVAVNGKNNTVRNCFIHDVNGGIALNGGNRYTLEGGGNKAENNHITRFDRLTKPLTCAVAINGVGNIMSHNEIHDAEQMAVIFYGNNHLIEYNEIYDVCKIADDTGVVYSGGDTTFRGNRIMYNYIHDLPETPDNGPNENSALYFDDQMSSAYVYGNVFENISWRGVQLEGGRNHVVKNNEFINVPYYVYIKNRNAGKDYSADSSNSLVSFLKAVPYRSSLWYNAYPELYDILEQAEDMGAPRYNTVTDNRYTAPSQIYAHDIAVMYGVFSGNLQISEKTADTSYMGKGE